MKKAYNIIFVAIFLVILALPFALTDFRSGGVSEDENRTLVAFIFAHYSGTPSSRRRLRVKRVQPKSWAARERLPPERSIARSI